MNYFKLLFFFLLIIFFSRCKDARQNPNNIPPSKTANGFSFETQEAENINDDAIEFSKKGKYKKAEQTFLRALQIEPNNVTILSNLGLNLSLVGDYYGAINYYQKSYKLSDSTHHIAAINLGLAYYNIESYKKGVDITTFVIHNATNKPFLASAYVNRAFNYIKMNNC
ncbi:MAG: tetratricopeptide repeat protein, partial [Oceanihabitans sp.]|nr:tetratricopeptide repeat protein [Oceanihabitans sp.]